MLNIDLSGQTALVTGATGQLGRVIVRTLAGCGAAVAVHYVHNSEKAAEIVAEITTSGGRAIAVGGDVSVAEEVQAMCDTIVAGLGASPGIVVANAVSQYKWVKVLEQSIADYESQYKTCVVQNVLLAQTFIPAMIEAKRGRYIAINTECAMQCFPNQSAYVSGKRGMDGVLRVLAKEVGEHQITVNQVAPGWMISDRDRERGSEKSEGYDSRVPMRRRGEDKDIANAVAFLASDLANFISGVYLPVCGGNVMPTI